MLNMGISEVFLYITQNTTNAMRLSNRAKNYFVTPFSSAHHISIVSAADSHAIQHTAINPLNKTTIQCTLCTGKPGSRAVECLSCTTPHTYT